MKGSKHTFFKGEVSLKFTPLNNTSTIPRFFNDKKCPYPTFYLPCEPRNTIKHARHFQAYSHKQQYESIVSKPLVIITIFQYLPAPQGKPQQMCSICKIRINSYFEVIYQIIQHIESESHIQNIHESTYSQYIK